MICQVSVKLEFVMDISLVTEINKMLHITLIFVKNPVPNFLNSKIITFPGLFLQEENFCITTFSTTGSCVAFLGIPSPNFRNTNSIIFMEMPLQEEFLAVSAIFI